VCGELSWRKSVGGWLSGLLMTGSIFTGGRLASYYLSRSTIAQHDDGCCRAGRAGMASVRTSAGLDTQGTRFPGEVHGQTDQLEAYTHFRGLLFTLRRHLEVSPLQFRLDNMPPQ